MRDSFLVVRRKENRSNSATQAAAKDLSPRLMVQHLESGHPLLVFQEGTRSLPGRLRRFRRGAVEAAVRAKVSIVALLL